MSETVLRNKVREMQVLIDGLSTNNIHMERQLSQIQEFMEKLMQEQAQLQIFHEELQDSRNQVHEWKDALQDRRNQVHAEQEALQDSRNQVEFLEKELEDNKHQLERLREELLKKTAYIAGVQSGIGWRILVYYRKKIRNKLAPIGTKRWMTYDKLFKFAKKEGTKTFIQKGKLNTAVKNEQFIIPSISDQDTGTIHTKISITSLKKNTNTLANKSVTENIRESADENVNKT